MIFGCRIFCVQIKAYTSANQNVMNSWLLLWLPLVKPLAPLLAITLTLSMGKQNPCHGCSHFRNGFHLTVRKVFPLTQAVSATQNTDISDISGG
jgi:hypothetical protein